MTKIVQDQLSVSTAAATFAPQSLAPYGSSLRPQIGCLLILWGYFGVEFTFNLY